MKETKRKTIYPEGGENICTGNCQENKSHDLTLRVTVCELEIKNLKYQLHYLCKPFIPKQKKSSAVETLNMNDLIKTGQKLKAAEKSLGDKIAGKFRDLIKRK
jgi:hypothetical protein